MSRKASTVVLRHRFRTSPRLRYPVAVVLMCDGEARIASTRWAATDLAFLAALVRRSSPNAMVRRWGIGRRTRSDALRNLGHVSPRESYWYVSSTPELLGIVSNRFAAFCGVGGQS
jgi:hypothetical protein